MWTGEATEASIFPSYAQYRIRSQTGHTFKIKMSSQTSILDLPREILEMTFQNISATKDVRNCHVACGVYNDPRISNIRSQIQFDNEGTFIQLIFMITM